MRPTILKGDLQRYLCTRARRGRVRLELWRLRHKTSVWLICTCGMTQFKCAPWLIVVCTCGMTQSKCVQWLIFMCSRDMTQFKYMSWLFHMKPRYSCQVYEWVMSHIWMCPGTHVTESFHKLICVEGRVEGSKCGGQRSTCCVTNSLSNWVVYTSRTCPCAAHHVCKCGGQHSTCGGGQGRNV